jgi:hypothetical protein
MNPICRTVFSLVASLFYLNTSAAADAVATVAGPNFDPKLRHALEQTRLIGAQTPAIPAFQWTIESTRPFKKTKIVQEIYTPVGLNGLVQAKTIAIVPPPQKQSGPAPAPSFSLRGLERVQETDLNLSFDAPGLKLPLIKGQTFELTVVHEGQKVVQRCLVGVAKPATQLNAAIAGNAASFECSGAAKYMGMNVSIVSKVVFFESLGFFFNEVEDIKSPLGNFVIRKRISDFKLL